jgi:mannitol-specific phosphotransferase system IIBC component
MPKSIPASDVKTIIFVCEAGIGSSLMSVNSLKKKLKQANVNEVNVVHKAARQVPQDAQLIVCHKGMAKMVRTRAPGAVVVGFTHFLNDPALDRIVKALISGTEIVEEG